MTRTVPTRWGRRGTFLILFGFGLLVFVGFFGLVADVGYAFVERVRTQSVLDAAASSSLLTANLELGSMDRSVREILAASSVDPSVLTKVQLQVRDRGVQLRLEALVPTSASFSSLFGMHRFSTHVSSVTTGEILYRPIPQEDFGLFACEELEVRGSLDSFDARRGPYQGPASRMPFDGSCEGGGNCGDEVLIGSNGDVIFGGAWLWGAVATSGGRIRKQGKGTNRIGRHIRVPGREFASPDSLSNEIIVHGKEHYRAGFPPLDCREATQFGESFLDHDGDLRHVHSGRGPTRLRTYTPRRAIESREGGRSDERLRFRGRSYALGNRSTIPQSQIYLDSPRIEGNWGFDPCLADEQGGFRLTTVGGGKGCEVSRAPVVLRTGFVYFFHHIELSRSTSIEVTGDYQEEGPALLFLHGNGLDGGPRDLDMSGGGATFRYIGSCGGSSCPPDLRPPALAILATDRSRLEIAGDFQLVVDVLAPGAEVHLSSTSGILGRILGGKVSMRSSWVRFHHDQAQAKRDLEEYFRPRVRSVRLLQ